MVSVLAARSPAGNHSFWVVADDFARLRATFADVSNASRWPCSTAY